MDLLGFVSSFKCCNNFPLKIYFSKSNFLEVYAVVYFICVLWYLEHTWRCQCLLHLAYVLDICMYCGVWSTHGAVYVFAICTWSAPDAGGERPL